MIYEIIHPGHELWEDATDYSEKCSWRAGKSLSGLMRNRSFSGWERVIIGIDKHTICSFCLLSKNDSLPDTLYTPFIGYIFVDEKFRGKRISEEMIHYSIAYLKKEGFKTVYIVSDHVNLYEKYGFNKVDTILTVHGNEEIIFSKKI